MGKTHVWIAVVAKHCCLHDTDLDNLRMLIDDKKAVKLRLETHPSIPRRLFYLFIR